MSTGTLLQIVPWVLLILTWYNLWQLQGKIKCMFRQPDGSVVYKTLPMKGDWVYYKNVPYHINRKRIDINWFKMWGILTLPIPLLEWKWDSEEPLDPTTFRNTWDTPDARGMADSKKDWQSMNEGIDQQVGARKAGGFERWLPFVAIGATLIVGFLVWQISGKMGIIEQQIQSLGGMVQSLK